ncbi:MAG: tetratricopeptide repeat protein [bacterium]|nr:tetratricopeptide repeat protein [bacterium]
MGLFSSKDEKFQKVFSVAMEFYNQKKFNEAINEFKKALAIKDDSVEALYYLGSAHFRKDDKENAKFILEKAIKLEPQYALFFEKEGMELFDNGDYEEAKLVFEEGFLVSNRPQLKRYYANVLSIIGELDKAITIYTDLLDEVEDKKEVYLDLAFCYTEVADKVKALDFFSKAHKLDPENTNILNNIGLLYARNNQYDEALKILKKAIVIEPENALLFQNLGNIYFSMGMYSEAEEAYKKAIEIDPSFEGETNLKGIEDYNSGKFKEEEDELLSLTMTSENQAEQFNSLGLFYFNKGKIDKAIESFKKALEIAPDYAVCYSNLGNAYAEQGLFFKALQALKDAIKIIPESAYLHNKLALFYEKQGKLDDADKEFEISSKLDPHYGNTLYLTGVLYESRGFLKQAKRFYEKFLRFGTEQNLISVAEHKLRSIKKILEPVKKQEGE